MPFIELWEKGEEKGGRQLKLVGHRVRQTCMKFPTWQCLIDESCCGKREAAERCEEVSRPDFESSIGDGLYQHG